MRTGRGERRRGARRRGAPALAALLAAATAMGACGGGGGGGASSGAGGKVQVVAGAYPLAELARRVGGGDVEVTDLTPGGTEPHDLELTTDQVDAIEDAAVVLYLGKGFQPGVEKAARRTKGTRADLLKADPASDRSSDPHLWLDPQAMGRALDRVRAVLVKVDPARADRYAERTAAFAGELASLDREYAQGLADCDRRTIVTSHAAFGRLAARYDLDEAAISGLAPDAEPQPARLAELTDRIRAEGITTVFTETLASPRAAEALAREAGATTAVLDPIEGRTAAQVAAGEDYLKTMRTNLGVLRQALGCR